MPKQARARARNRVRARARARARARVRLRVRLRLRVRSALKRDLIVSVCPLVTARCIGVSPSGRSKYACYMRMHM